MQNNDAQRLATELARLDRRELIPRLLNYRARARLDFTAEYLEGLSTEQLRHLLMAAALCLPAQ